MQDLSDILGLKRDPVASGRPTPVATPQAELIAEPIPDPSVVSPRHLRRFSLAVVFSLAACATASAPGLSNGPAIQPVLSPNERALAFSLEAPGEGAIGPNLRLWATHYHTPEITPAAAPITLTSGTGVRVTAVGAAGAA